MVWLVFAIYIDSYLFVFSTAILQLAFGVNSSLRICDGAILLCLVCYITTKVFIYLFLVEKAHIIRGSPKRRLTSKLYIFNSFGMIGLYIVVAVLGFVFRFTRMENGTCVIGLGNIAMIPLITFDTIVNIYLTILFLLPLKNLYTFKNSYKTPASTKLRSVALRTFVGALCTLASSITNLVVLMALDGEPGWVCLMCCSSDILFSAIVIQWVTSRDNAGTTGANLEGDTLKDSTNTTNQKCLRFSTRFSPNTTAVATDIGEIFLDSATELERVGSVSSSNPLNQSGQPEGPLPSPGRVVVTTTIKQESRPTRTVIDDMFIDRETDLAYLRPVRYDRAFDNSMRRETEITGGSHH